MNDGTRAWEEEPGVASASRVVVLVWLGLLAAAAAGGFLVAMLAGGASDPRFDRWLRAADWLKAIGPYVAALYGANVIGNNLHPASGDAAG